MDSEYSRFCDRRSVDLLRHQIPTEFGCGKPEAPSLVVSRSLATEFSFLRDLVENNPRGVVHPKLRYPQIKSQISMSGQLPMTLDPLSNYGVMTPGPVSLRGVRFTSSPQPSMVGIGRGNIDGVTVVLVDRLNRQKEEDFYLLHVSTDAYDAGLHLQDKSATLVTLRPNSAEVWFYGEKPTWADAMLAQETQLVKIRKYLWPISKTKQALSIGIAAVLLAAVFVRVEIIPRF